MARAVAVAASIAVVVATEAYDAVTLTEGNHNYFTIILGVLFPLLLASVVLLATSQLDVLLCFSALFWSVVDDVPVDFDWPRLSGFPPGVTHEAMQIVIYVLSLAFMSAFLWSALRGSKADFRQTVVSIALGALALLISYADDIPLNFINDMVNDQWYQIYTLEHIVGAAVAALTIFVATSQHRSGGARDRVQQVGIKASQMAQAGP